MLWEVEIHPVPSEIDREGNRVLADARALGAASVTSVRAAHSFLVEGNLNEDQVRGPIVRLLGDGVAEKCIVRPLPATAETQVTELRGKSLLNVLFKPGVTDNVGLTAMSALTDLGLPVSTVATCRKYWINSDAKPADLDRLSAKVLSNEAIEHVISGPLPLKTIALGTEYKFKLTIIPIRGMNDEALAKLSKEGQLYLSVVEMQTIRDYFVSLDRDPTDIELETVAQTWSEHCSHKTLGGRIRYRDENGERRFESMLKETVFAATQELRKRAGADDWCVSVFKDNAGVVTFNDEYDVCIKVETHNHPSALEPYGGANTGLGGVIRDPLGTGLGAKPVCSTDVFCFASPDTPYSELPPGVLHPKTVMRGVVSGVRDYGNRMGIPTVNGAVYFDDRYVGNPLVYCGNVALIPVGKWKKHVEVGDLVVAVGGKTGRDGIHGATFSSAELTENSEMLSGGAVQIGNAITEKMLMDVILAARDRGLYNAITDCGAGGFSSAVGEMGEETGAEVWLEKCPLKYSGLSYTEIWISEAQERMILAVPEGKWNEFHTLCASEGVEATVIGKYTGSQRLVLKYNGEEVGNLAMEFLHDGRPPVVREAVYEAQPETNALKPSAGNSQTKSVSATLDAILGSLNVCSKEWIIRQYDHEVQAGSVVKPLVGVANDGPSDAAVVRPDLGSQRGLAISCGMNPRLGDLDPYWMAASAIDEAVRNCVAVGADPKKIAILDNFCWGNTERPETLGSLVRASLACHDVAIAFGTPFVSGKDSLNNEFKYFEGGKQTVITIPSSLLITALGQLETVEQAVTMDLKEAGNVLLLVGETKDEMGGSHYALVNGLTGGLVPKVDLKNAPTTFAALHQAILTGDVRSCHDLSEGGLAVALAEMAFAGGLGVDVQIGSVGDGLAPEVALFSESNTRFVLEVPADKADAVSLVFSKAGVRIAKLGSVTAKANVVIRSADQKTLVERPCVELKEIWQKPLRWD
jgi:phosphoribosylformylglycinamidine synthase II